MPRPMRTVTPIRPHEVAEHHGLAYSLWMPGDTSPRAGVVIIHGAGSCKERHHDFARAAAASGLAAVALDLPGHGASRGPLDAGVLDDLGAVVSLLRGRLEPGRRPIALRGSSLGGYLAIVAAAHVDVDAVVAICPAGNEGLRRGLLDGRFTFAANQPSLAAFLSEHDLFAAVHSLRVPLLLLHAEGDEQVPVEHSRELAKRAGHAQSRLITVPGGHHRSVQHDPELQAVSLRWIGRVMGEAERSGP